MKKNIILVTVLSIASINSYSEDLDYLLYKKKQNIASWFLFQEKNVDSGEVKIMANLEPTNKKIEDPVIFLLPNCHSDKNMRLTLRFITLPEYDYANNKVTFSFDNKFTINDFEAKTIKSNKLNGGLLEIDYLYNIKTENLVSKFKNDKKNKKNLEKESDIFNNMLKAETMKIKFTNIKFTHTSEYKISSFNNVVKELSNQCHN